jgi:hypothetical protein
MDNYDLSEEILFLNDFGSYLATTEKENNCL